MKIFDCFMYFDEDLVLDLRLNYLNQFVDHFIIVESVFNHKGEKKKPQFDIEKFKKFKDKINYILLEDDAKNIVNIYENDTFNDEKDKEILNALKLKQVDIEEFVTESFNEPVFVHLNTMDYNVRKDGAPSSKSDFYLNPKEYKSTFLYAIKHGIISYCSFTSE